MQLNTRSLAVAVSGGRDSTALLHCTARLARDHGVSVHALHVHHGLMADADAWVLHLRRQCRRWVRAGLPVTLHVHRLSSAPPPGASIEAWARRERYAALATMARAASCDTVLLAQHGRDQAETFLLQALRGGAPRGLAGMGSERESHGVRWSRPWLSRPREAIDAYLARHRLKAVEDASNLQARFARGRLRAAVWPALLGAFPDAEAALAAAGRRAHEAACCLEILATIDLTSAFDANGRLLVAALRALDGARQRNALRHALQRLTGRSAPESLVDRLCSEAFAVPIGYWPVPGGELRLYDRRIEFIAGAGRTEPFEPSGEPIDMQRPGRYRVAGAGTLVVTAVRSGGVAAGALAAVHWRPRRGGEQFQFDAGSMPRSLKKQYQARRIAPWARDAPLLYAEDSLLFVPGLGLDARMRASGGRQRMLVWLRADEGAA